MGLYGTNAGEVAEDLIDEDDIVREILTPNNIISAPCDADDDQESKICAVNLALAS